jgi:hypothetical protein
VHRFVWYRLEETFLVSYTGCGLPYILFLFLNQPAVMARALWVDFVPGLLSDAMFVVAIGISWYWVGLNIRPWRQRNSLPLFTRPLLRIMADLLLVASSAYFSELFRRVDVAHMGLQWRAPMLACFLAWCLGSAFVFGRDLIYYLIYYLRHKLRAATGADAGVQ